MEVEFMTADTTLPPCMPLPRAMLRLPISSTAKVMYARMLDIVFLSGIEDTNGIYLSISPSWNWRRALARSTMTVKRSLNELEDAGLILRCVRASGNPQDICTHSQEGGQPLMNEKLEALNQEIEKTEKEAALGATGGKASDPSGQGADPEGTDAPALHQSRHAGKLPSPPRSHHG